MEQGFHRESFITYIEETEHINRSFLHTLLDYSPGHAKYAQEHEEITEALRIGDAFHAAILEPKRFEKEYVVLPLDCKPGSGTGMKARKEAYELIAAELGQTIIQPDDMQNIKEMQAVVQSDQEALDLLSDGESEVSGYWTDPEYEVQCKIRLDFINKKHKIIVDLKSCSDARHFPFRASAFDHGYDLQAFMGLLGVTEITGEAHNDFKFICVESKGYHGLRIWEADQEMLDTGYRKYQKAMVLYKQCLESGEWPGYNSSPMPLGSPSYAKERFSEAYYD